MASGKTDVHENDVLDHFLRSATVTATSGWLALYSVAPGESAAGTELTGNNYGRIAAGFSAASGGVVVNAGTITFTATGGAWSQIVGHSLMTLETGGTAMYYEDSVAGPTLADGDSHEFDPSDVTVTET